MDYGRKPTFKLQLVYPSRTKEISLEDYCDASWDSDKDSQVGYVLY